MKKVLLSFVAAIMLLMGMSVNSDALPFKDVINLAPDRYMNTFLEHQGFHFDLDNDILAIGNINPGDTILSARLGIRFRDDKINLPIVGPTDDLQSEHALVIPDGHFLGASYFEVDTGWWNLPVLAYVGSDHKLNVHVLNVPSFPLFVLGDYFIDRARITGQYDVAHAPVPEPGTMILLGSGLIGVIAARRKFMA